MSTQNTWTVGTRLLLVLGVGLLLVLAWMGGRMSAGGAGPMGMMSSGTYGDMGMMSSGTYGDMGRGQHMQGGGSLMGAAPADSGDAFAGEAGMRRCRAMMGTMAGMHRSMQSMMGGDMMGEGGRMEGRMGSMHEQMGAMQEMDPEQMRSLCRTMQETMRAAMDGSNPTSGDGDDRDGTLEGLSLTGETKQWLRGARGVDTVEDRTGQGEVVIEVGAAGGMQYSPAAVRIDPGTTVRWRWTGKGGLHDVAFTNAEISTSLKGEEGATFVHTFTEPGEYRYECTPHSGIGMRGTVIVAENGGS
ncbi:halocyanin domain-containing protein [Salinibacter sp.]|uniref:halocyanin domain-containing protein n=1 Tax=Salinibacter sp. TaxID=2065818 RepID=UPI0021E78E38|nr:halocyanin domain-containing protein [Salinibacter sp.]